MKQQTYNSIDYVSSGSTNRYFAYKFNKRFAWAKAYEGCKAVKSTRIVLILKSGIFQHNIHITRYLYCLEFDSAKTTVRKVSAYSLRFIRFCNWF